MPRTPREHYWSTQPADPLPAATPARALEDAYAAYLAAAKGLAAITPCAVAWPVSLDDVAPTRCQLLEGHQGGHRHRVLGTQVVVTW